MYLSARSKLTGLLVAAASVAATTAVIFPLRHAVPAVSTGVLYLLGVLLVSTYWGLAIGLLTSLASAAAFNFFHIPPTGHFTIADPQNWVALGVYFAAAVVTSTLATGARARAVEADSRRREADLAAELARVVLGAPELDKALPTAATRIGEAVGADGLRLELGWVDSSDDEQAIPLVDEGRRVGTLLVPRDAPAQLRERLERRVVPPLTALLTAAVRRALLEEEAVEAKAFRRSDELKTALLRAVSHDLRTPLTAISTAAGGVASPSVGQSEREDLAAVIASEAKRLSRLVENLIDLSRLEGGRLQSRRDWSSVSEVIESAAGHLSGVSRLDVQLDPELPLVKVDAAQLERALANLLENAARHSDGEPIAVRARSDGRRLAIRVSDHGPGIPKEELRRIFEPFYRGDGGGGSGLGLAIARGFIEANGGRIWAQSLPDQGASFTIEFPLEEKAPAAERVGL